VRRLQQVHAVPGDLGADAGDIVGMVDRLAEHRVAHRAAGAVRHGRYKGGDGDERRGLALAPADMTAGLDADEQRVLAAVALVGDDRHGDVEEVDALDLHGASGSMSDVQLALPANSAATMRLRSR
jgi:hypothetical protein